MAHLELSVGDDKARTVQNSSASTGDDHGESAADRGQKAGQKAESQASSGGKCERQAAERHQEQGRAANESGEKRIPPSTNTVKSEPHWDPTDSPKGDSPAKAPE